MNWNDYIGLPFAHGGRGPDSFDCYGLVAAVLRGARGLDLPDWHSATPDAQGASRAIASALAGECAGGRAARVEQPENYDVAIVGSSVRPHHVGVYVGGGVLHASYYLGSAWHPLARFKMLYPHTEFYRWQP